MADFYRNTVHGNTVGLTSERGILGPDNPPPFGAAGGKEPNDVYENETGVLIPAGASGVIVRFTRIHNNSKVGIEQLGDNSLVIANDVYENPIGIRGTRVIGPSRLGQRPAQPDPQQRQGRLGAARRRTSASTASSTTRWASTSPTIRATRSSTTT